MYLGMQAGRQAGIRKTAFSRGYFYILLERRKRLQCKTINLGTRPRVCARDVIKFSNPKLKSH